MTTHWAPFVLASDDRLPLDLSFLYQEERPAGKHGFLTADRDRFVFQDGTEGRFWGVNFNSGANFPEHDCSEMVARRLAKIGINLVRTHQMDAEWATPNLFRFNRAEPRRDTRSLDPRSLDRLDYLIHCLKKRGIYIYLDMLTYRRFLPGDGVAAAHELSDAAKPYTYFDPKLIELQKEFARQLWTHVNPYTGLAYADEPAIVLTEIKNESDLFTQPPVLEPYRSQLETRYREWLECRDLPSPNGAPDFAKPDETMAQFYVDVMDDFYREMIVFLREIGVKVPVAGTNWTINVGLLAAQKSTDFTDSHTYWNYPWNDPPGTVNSILMVSAPRTVFPRLSLMRLTDKPFFVSEWDQAWPHPWRAESPLAFAATAALQGWGGAAIHTYRYNTWPPEDRLGGGSSTINGVVYRNFFDCFNDPAKIGLFYHAALLLRRGDVRRGEKLVPIRIPEDCSFLTRERQIEALRLVERHRIGLTFGPDDDAIGPDCDLDPDESRILSDTGELGRNPDKHIAWISASRTKAAWGLLGEAGALSLDGVTFEVKTDFAVLAISSLSDDPIAHSASLLLTAVGRCENTDVRYTEDGGRMLHPGSAPTRIEVIEARVQLATTRDDLKVWVISDKGEAVAPLKTQYQDGVLTFTIGPRPEWDPCSMYYLITQ